MAPLRTPLLIAFSLFAAACSAPMPMDTSADAHLRHAPPRADAQIPPPVQAVPVLPKPRPSARPETYSVVVSNVRVQDLLFALARDARINIDIHSDVAGTVTLNAIDQTLPQLLHRISRQTDMRYEMDGQNLLVTRDTPFLRLYRVDYLNMVRDTRAMVTMSSAITAGAVTGAAGGAAGGAGAAPGGAGGVVGSGATTQQILNTSNNRFWDSLVGNVRDILRETDRVLPAQTEGAAAAAAAKPGAEAPAAPAAGTPQFREAASVIAHPETGILSVRATARQHERVQEFLDNVLASARRQVLIEATVVEVRLNNQFQRGINWSVAPRGLGGGITINQPGGAAGPAGVTTNNFTVGFTNSDGNISLLLRFLESFGTLRVLSSPKMSVLNNQTAMLRVVNNLVYFTLRPTTVAVTAAGGGVINLNDIPFESTPNTYAVGLVMSVTPQISDSDRIILNMRPTVTRQIGEVIDPNPSLRRQNISNPVPLLQTRELESILQVHSGEIAVLGGLMQDEVDNIQDGIPGTSGTFLGRLFRQERQTNLKTELVIFLRPTVIRDPSVEGDFRTLRTMLPGDDFLRRPNPGLAVPAEAAPPRAP